MWVSGGTSPSGMSISLVGSPVQYISTHNIQIGNTPVKGLSLNTYDIKLTN